MRYEMFLNKYLISSAFSLGSSFLCQFVAIQLYLSYENSSEKKVQ